MIPQGSHNEELQKADRIAYLIAGHLGGTLTPEEGEELDDWVSESDDNLALFEKLTDEENIEAAIAQFNRIEQSKMPALDQLKKQIRKDNRKQFPVRTFLGAASVLVIGLLAWWLWPTTKRTPIDKTLSHVSTQDELPAASNQAVLTLSSGRTIILDSASKGLLATEGSISINQNANGALQYTGTESSMRYNTVSTPRGGQYKLVLGDGTKVWLNADSYMKFPAGFNEKQRKVELKGEAWFEVAKNKEHPFIVNILTANGNGGTVEVLGTHFNVNAYGDQDRAVKTTLVEGLVNVTSHGASKLLHPGEQAIWSLDSDKDAISIRRLPDLYEALAWTKGKFVFRDATIFSIGEQIKRWYDVDVEYQGNITQHFNTEADRSLPLQKLLDGLEGTGEAKFILSGRKLTIKPAKVLQ
jgi:transmembrane sensor